MYLDLSKFWTLGQSVNSPQCQFIHLSNGVMMVPCLMLCAGIIIITYVLMWVPQSVTTPTQQTRQRTPHPQLMPTVLT